MLKVIDLQWEKIDFIDQVPQTGAYKPWAYTTS